MLPAGSRPLENPLGGAPGFALANVYVLPGLPAEMEAMFEHVAAELRGGAPIVSWRRTYRTTESRIVAVLEAAEERHPGVLVGSYPSFRPDGQRGRGRREVVRPRRVRRRRGVDRGRARGGDAVNPQLLELARTLEADDTRLAAEIEAVSGLQHRAAAVAARAAELEEFAHALPFERARLDGALAEARADAALHEREQADAERRAESTHGEQQAEARRAAVRAADAASVARRQAERVAAGTEELEAQAAALDGEARALEAEAAAVTGAIRVAPSIAHGTVPDPPPDLAGLVEWGSRARATFLVAISGLEARRERVVREANELAAAALGEPVSLSVAAVRERLESL